MYLKNVQWNVLVTCFYVHLDNKARFCKVSGRITVGRRFFFTWNVLVTCFYVHLDTCNIRFCNVSGRITDAWKKNCYGLLWHFIYIVCGGCVTVQLPNDEIVSLIFHYTFQIKMICVSPGKECIYIYWYIYIYTCMSQCCWWWLLEDLHNWSYCTINLIILIKFHF